MASKNVESVQAEHAGFNARDWDSIRRLFADDCVFVDGRGVVHKGPEAFVNDYAKGWPEAFSDAEVTEAKYHDAGDTVVESSSERARMTVRSDRCQRPIVASSFPTARSTTSGPMARSSAVTPISTCTGCSYSSGTRSRQPIRRRTAHRPAERPWCPEPDIVEQHHHNIRGPRRQASAGWFASAR